MPVKLNLFVVLMLIFCQALCEKITLTICELSITRGTKKDPHQIALISYGQVVDKNTPLKANIEAYNHYCIEKGQSLKITSLNYHLARVLYTFKKSIDFGDYTDFSPSVFEDSEIKESKVCLFLGYQTYLGPENKRVVQVYLNFLTDKTKIDQKDVLFLDVKNDKNYFTVELNKFLKLEVEEKPKRSNRENIMYKKCREKTENSVVKFDLTGQPFSVFTGATFYMAFLNVKSIKTTLTVNSLENPSFDCLTDSLKISYSGQQEGNNILIV